MITIYDIAKKTGFSPTTVSKALNNYYGVKKETYEAILKASKEMGYIPNSAARSLKTKKTWLVGIISSEELKTAIGHTHFGAILASSQMQLAEAGYDVIFISNTMTGKNRSFIDHCNSRGIEGVIVAASIPFTKIIKDLLESNIKIVSIETPYDKKYSVICDNKKGTEKAVLYLHSLGHRRIAYISCPLNSTAGIERYQAFYENMFLLGIPVNKKWITETYDYSVKAGYKAAGYMMENCGEKPSAIFVGYGEGAIGVLNYLEENNYRVPDDISVICFDNIEMTISRGLTVIRQDRAKIGELAANILLSQIEGKELNYPFDNRIETSLIERNTCKKI